MIKLRAILKIDLNYVIFKSDLRNCDLSIYFVPYATSSTI